MQIYSMFQTHLKVDLYPNLLACVSKSLLELAGGILMIGKVASNRRNIIIFQ